MSHRITIDEILHLASGLSPIERERLIDELGKTFHGKAEATTDTGRGIRGNLRGQSVNPKTILETRRDLWFGFPRDGI